MTTVVRRTIGYGDAGAVQTLNRMRALVNASLTVPVVVETAVGIVSMVPSRDYPRMAEAIQAWLARVFKFIPDPVGVELLRTPEYQINELHTRGMILGDCDDAATVGAAMAKAVGLRAEFRAVGFQPGGPLRHVFAILTGPAASAIPWARGVSLDVTRPAGTRAVVVRQVVVPV